MFWALHLLTHHRRAAKEAKQLLKKRKTSLVLYNAFGLVEIQHKASESVNKIFATAISMSKDLPKDQQDDTILLWRSWIWESLRNGRSGHATQLLFQLTEDSLPHLIDDGDALTETIFPPAAVLRNRQVLEDGIDRCFFKSSYYQAALYAEILALFTYFLHGRSIAAGLVSFQETANYYRQKEGHIYFTELLHQARAEFIMYHVNQSRPYKPMDIKGILSESIKLFPHNTMFLVSYAHFELSFGLNDRLRSFLSHPKLFESQDMPVNSLFSIWSEVRRLPELGGSTHGIRAMFERSVESKA
jgi:nuclear exosome regulator NRDE2